MVVKEAIAMTIIGERKFLAVHKRGKKYQA